VSEADERLVIPAEVPELWPILRAGLRSRVRLFDLWCPKGDRLIEVLKVAGRPLAISDHGRLRNEVRVSGESRRQRVSRWGRRELNAGLWVDGDEVLPPFPCSCSHQRLSVPGEWLRAQLVDGVRRRVFDQATRAESAAV